MPDLQQLESRARKTFDLPTAQAAQEGAHVGVWIQPEGHRKLFLELREDKWYVLHGSQLVDCGHPPVSTLQQLKDHIADANVD